MDTLLTSSKGSVSLSEIARVTATCCFYKNIQRGYGYLGLLLMLSCYVYSLHAAKIALFAGEGVFKTAFWYGPVLAGEFYCIYLFLNLAGWPRWNDIVKRTWYGVGVITIGCGALLTFYHVMSSWGLYKPMIGWLSVFMAISIPIWAMPAAKTMSVTFKLRGQEGESIVWQDLPLEEAEQVIGTARKFLRQATKQPI